MHRIDTPTAQADKFGPGKNGFTNGDPATGRRATDLNSDMWDAVQEEICAVIEKSGLALNKDQHDQLYQAIVKIITGKIPDALLKKNNLSDLADKALARANLQLKTAAQKDIVTSTSDTTADRVPVVGWQGLGLAAQFRMGQVSQFLAYASTDLKEVPANGAGWQSAYGATRRAQIFMTTGGNVYSRFSLSDVTYDVDTPWAIHYTTLNKPTAADVGAVAKTGDTMTGRLIVNFDGEAIRLKPKTAGYASYLISVDSANVNHWYVGAGSTGNADVVFNNYKGGNNSINLKSDGSLNITATNGKDVNIYGQVVPSNYTNFDSRYINADGATFAGFVSGDAARPYMRHRVSNAVVQLAKAGDSYTKAESDNGYMAKTGAYTKGESDARYQLKNNASRAANGWFKDTTTGMIYQWGRNASSVVGNTTVTFPIAFPNACLNVQNTLIRNSGSAGERPWGFVTSFNNTSVNLSSDATGSYWYAIGY
ncbi:gp53-like domain-containing protein [Enterobacter ludwigii]|uniref:gp53-like domain-containing protein n=1 Tax=Enterobacter ludwigii TaxID=299767 RepID=UPI00273F4A9D|nr:hypothetical protein [Enterobacter ludwigii]MDP5159461.1 hypothetical protein [Enterobacter ludwigii]